LDSPTSVDMKNSYIIKNADASFDTYYKHMTKKRHLNDHKDDEDSLWRKNHSLSWLSQTTSNTNTIDAVVMASMVENGQITPGLSIWSFDFI
jgi:hypothetical protein